jgi:hypothetical protein
MTRALALAHPLIAASALIDTLDWARRVIVLGCAAALILAGEIRPL